MATLRTFVAVETTLEIQSQAGRLIEQLQHTTAKVNWVRTSNLHVTMKFLGEVRTDGIADVCQAVEDSVKDKPSFEVECRGAGAFPDNAQPRTIWLGVENGRQDMVDLHGSFPGLGESRDGPAINAGEELAPRRTSLFLRDAPHARP